MKKKILSMAVIAFIVLTASTSFGQTVDKKSEKARENILEGKKDVLEAKQDLKVAQKDSVADFQVFKEEAEAKILKNEKILANLKVKVTNADLKDKADCEKNLAVLEQKNVTLEKRLADYKPNGETKWSSFKTEYNNDMDELEKELKDFTIENEK